MLNLAIEHPWWLLLLIPLVIGVAMRIPSTYLFKAHSHIHIAPFYLKKSSILCKTWRRFASALPFWTRALILVLIVAALADITRGDVLVTTQKISQRFIVNIDVSSSMHGFNTPLKTITCKQNAIFFSRIRGACRALYRLVDVVEREALSEGPHVALALLQFAFKSVVVSYPTPDYVRFREKIDGLEFKNHGLSTATSMHFAIWDMLLMAFKRNMEGDSGFTHLTGEDLRKIWSALAPGQGPLYLPKDVAEKLALMRQEMRDTVFIVPTDAVVYYLKDRMDANWIHPTIRRVMQLAEYVEIPVYFFSTDEYYPELHRLARRTGFGPENGPHRGDFLMVRKEQEEYRIEELVDKVLASRMGMTIPAYEKRRESYADLILELILTLAVFGVLWRKLVVPSLTDPE